MYRKASSRERAILGKSKLRHHRSTQNGFRCSRFHSHFAHQPTQACYLRNFLYSIILSRHISMRTTSQRSSGALITPCSVKSTVQEHTISCVSLDQLKDVSPELIKLRTSLIPKLDLQFSTTRWASKVVPKDKSHWYREHRTTEPKAFTDTIGSCSDSKGRKQLQLKRFWQSTWGTIREAAAEELWTA